MPPERLTPLDASFLYLERPPAHMHVAALSVFDPSTRPDGRLPFDEVAARLAARLHLAPRLRQRVRFVPGNVALPVWADDARFDLDAHVRRAALPAPGGRRELADLVGRIVSTPLERSKPLWEVSVIEGLEGGHVATLMKVHHALMDGIAGMQLAMAMYDPDREPPPAERPRPWSPEREPSTAELLAEAVLEQATHPLEAAVHAVGVLRRTPLLAAVGVGAVAAGVREIVGRGVRPSSSLNARIGPDRRFAMTEAPLQRFKDVKDALGGSVNDAVLATVAGALHLLLKERGEATRGRTVRVLVPVSVRPAAGGPSGNRVAPAFVDVPIGAMSARRRLSEVRAATETLRSSMAAMSVDAIVALGAFAPAAFLAAGARAVSRGPWFNLVVSNVPGPQQPLYLAGARLVATYPSMPIAENSALSVACTSIGGTMAFGLTGDRVAMPDLERLTVGIDDALAALAKAAGV